VLKRIPWLFALLCLLSASQGLAQTVLNPRIVEFVPSADHAALTSDNQPMVTRYDLGFYLVGATAPFQVIDLGKPTPGAGGTISIDFSTRVSAWPLANGDYLARVTAVGPTGTGVSEASNAFTFLTCTYSVTPTAATVATGGGSTTVSLTAPAGCAWTTASGASWITVGTAGGAGSASVTLTAAANPGGNSRSTTVTVAGQNVNVTQAGATCSFAVNPTSLSFGSAGGTGTVTLSSSAGCAWTAVSGASWVTAAPAAGSGGTAVSLTAAVNTTSAARTASVTMGGLTIVVVQSATTKPLAPGRVRLLIGK